MKIYKKMEEMFQDIKDKKYCLAYDYGYNELDEVRYIHKYIHIENIRELKEYIKTDKHLYEIAYKRVRKLYFDIDNLDLTQDEAELFINKFIIILQNELNINITPKQLIVIKNEGKDKKGNITDNIHSLHIIINGFKMDYTQQLTLATYINDKYEYELDLNVYKKNQNFRLYNQSKLKYGIRLINFYNGEINLTDTLINNTNNSKDLKYNLQYDILKNNTKPVLEIHEEDIIYNIIYKDDISNSIFNNNRDWKTITNIISKYKLYNLNDWNDKSVELTTDHNYTYEKNNLYISKINNNKVSSTINLLYKIVSKYSSYFIIDKKNRIDKEIIKALNKIYCSKITDEIIYNINNPTKTKMINRQNNITYKEKVLYKFVNKQGLNTIINIKNGFIIDEDKNVNNIYYDNITIDKEKIFNEIENITEARDKTNEFLKNSKKLMVIKSKWGTGKTSNIIKNVIDKYDKILIITESNALNSKLLDDFSEYNFVSHQDKDIDISKKNNVICSIQSINKVKNSFYDIVIIDEYESVLSSYNSSKTFKSANTTPLEAFETLKFICLKSDKCMILDADISEDKAKLFIDLIGQENSVVYKNNQKTFDKINLYLYSKINILYDVIFEKIYNNKKIAIASASKKKLDILIEDLNKRNICKILKIDVDGAFIYHNNTIEVLDKDMTIQKLEQIIIDNKIDIFGYTPTIKTGISINTDYFNITIGLTSCHSILYNEMIQMIMRQRRLKDNEIHILLEGYTKFNLNKSYDYINRKQSIDQNLINILNNQNDNIIYNKNQVSEEYYILQTINNKNLYNSKTNYVYNFIYLLKYHHLTYKYIEERYDDLLEQININEAVKEYEKVKMNKWLGIKLLDYHNYILTDNKTKLNKEYINELTDEDKQIFFKTKAVYSLFDINNKIYKINQLNQYKNLREDGITSYEIDDMIENIIKNYNNEYFYSNYIKRNAIDNIKIINKLYNNSVEYTQTIDDKQNIKVVLIDEMLYALNVFFVAKTENNLYDKQTKIFYNQELSNKSFKEFIIDNKELIQNIYNYYTEKTLLFDIKNNNHIKYIYHKIKDLLMVIDIKMEYEDPNHTNRNNSIIRFINNKEVVIYKKNRETNTLKHLKNNHIRLSFNKNDVMNCQEICKYFYETNEGYKMKNIKKINKKDIIKIRNNLLLNDLQQTIKINELLNGSTILFKDYYYNNIVDMNISNVKKDNYGRNSITLNKKKIEVFEYKTKYNRYYRPYNANIPIIKTKDISVVVSNMNDFDNKIELDDIKLEAINNGLYLNLDNTIEECIEQDYKEVLLSNNQKLDILKEIKQNTNIEVIAY
tara:strand:- start:939 stop:4886 length:3948 start_codon:yes stop_codon:yes gene_type:complete